MHFLHGLGGIGLGMRAVGNAAALLVKQVETFQKCGFRPIPGNGRKHAGLRLL